MLPNEPVYVLLDIGVVVKAFTFASVAIDDAKKYADISELQPENA